MGATTIRIKDRTFICQQYSVSQVLELLLILGEALAGPLSKLLGREVSSDMGEISAALQEATDDQTQSTMLEVFGAIRKVGGVEVVVQVLQTTYFEDRPLDSRKRLDEVFSGAGSLIELVTLTWRVLVYQLSPLVEELRPQLSKLGGGGARKQPN